MFAGGEGAPKNDQKAVRWFLAAAKKGNLVKAAKHVFDPRNVTSLKAVWEDRKWIGGV